MQINDFTKIESAVSIYNRLTRMPPIARRDGPNYKFKDGEAVVIKTWEEYKKKNGRKAKESTYNCYETAANNHNKMVQLRKKEAEALIQRELNGRLLTEDDRKTMNDQQVAQSEEWGCLLSYPKKRKAVSDMIAVDDDEDEDIETKILFGDESSGALCVKQPRKMWNQQPMELKKKYINEWETMVHNANKVAAAPPSKSKYCQQIGVPITSFNTLLKTKGNTLPVGQTPSLPQASEDRLVEYCMYRSHFGFGLDWTSVRSMAKHIGTKIGLADFHATTGWLNEFKKTLHWCHIPKKMSNNGVQSIQRNEQKTRGRIQ